MPCTISNFHLAECVLPRPGTISGRQSVFRHVPGRFLVGRVCSATSRMDFRSAEGVPSCPGSISGRQSVFRRVPGRFLVGRVCSAASRVDFRSAEDVLPRLGSIHEVNELFDMIQRAGPNHVPDPENFQN